MKTRVKVRTADLLLAVTAKRAEIVKKHEREAATYDQRLADYRAKVSKALRDAADKVDNGGALPVFNSYNGTFKKLSEPTKPSLNLSKIDRTIATLLIAADEAISVTADDYAEYLA